MANVTEVRVSPGKENSRTEQEILTLGKKMLPSPKSPSMQTTPSTRVPGVDEEMLFLKTPYMKNYMNKESWKELHDPTGRFDFKNMTKAEFTRSVEEIFTQIAAQGREGDTDLAHVTPAEKNLLEELGGAGTVNPRTGLLEYYGGYGSTSVPPPPPPAVQYGQKGEAVTSNAPSSPVTPWNQPKHPVIQYGQKYTSTDTGVQAKPPSSTYGKYATPSTPPPPSTPPETNVTLDPQIDTPQNQDLSIFEKSRNQDINTLSETVNWNEPQPQKSNFELPSLDVMSWITDPIIREIGETFNVDKNTVEGFQDFLGDLGITPIIYKAINELGWWNAQQGQNPPPSYTPPGSPPAGAPPGTEQYSVTGEPMPGLGSYAIPELDPESPGYIPPSPPLVPQPATYTAPQMTLQSMQANKEWWDNFYDFYGGTLV